MDKLNEIPILEWELPIKVYEKVLEETKLTYENAFSDMLVITDRTMKILTFFFTFLSGMGIYYFKYGTPICAALILGVLASYNIILLYKNLRGYTGVSKGLLPNNILTIDFDRTDFSDEVKEKLLYKNLVEQYWNSTNRIIEAKKGRVKLYDKSLKLTLVSILLISCYLGYLIFSYPY